MSHTICGRLTGIAAMPAVFAALMLAVSAPAPASAADNVHFLSPAKGEHIKALADLDARPETAASEDAKGWIRLLYFADVEAARSRFERALEIDPAAKSPLLGMALVHFSRGESESLAECVRTLVERFPASPEAEIVARGKAGFLSAAMQDSTHGKQTEWLEKLLSAGPAGPFFATAVRERLVYQLLVEEQYDRAFALWLENGNVPSYYVLGMLGPEGAAWFDETLPPEEAVNLGAKYQSGIEEISWRPARAEKHYPFSPLGLTGAVTGQGAVSYMLAYVKASKKTSVALRLSGLGSHKVWVNGTLVGVADRFKDDLPEATAFGATLAEGWNSILVKNVAGGTRWVRYYGQSCPFQRPVLRVTAPGGGPAQGLSYSSDFKTGDAPSVSARGFERECEAPAVGALPALEAAEAAASRTVPDLLFLAMALDGYGLDDKSYAAYEKLQEAHQGWPLANHMLALAIVENPHYSWDLKRIKRRSLNEEAKKLDPAFLPAVMAIIDERADKNPESVLDDLSALAEKRKDSREVWDKLLNVYASLGWEADKLRIMKEISRRWPEEPETLEMWESYYGEAGDAAKAMAYARKGLEVQGMHALTDRLSWYWERLGMYDKLVPAIERRIEKRPEEFRTMQRLSHLLVQLGRLDRALEVLGMIADGNPEDRSVLSEMANVYALKGDEARARDLMAKILEQPAKFGIYDNDIRRSLHYAGSGAYEDWFSPFEVNADEIIRDTAEAAKACTDVSSVVLFEQRIVRFHGADLKAAEEFIEQIVKIMNKAGGEKYGRLMSEGRMLEARVKTPDGRILEPDPVQEGWNMALPKLDRDSIIHLKYINDAGVQPPAEGLRQIHQGPQIRRTDEFVLRLRYVVIMPASAKYTVRIRNLEAKPEETVEGDEKVLTWDLKDVKDVVEEQFSPQDWEVLPQISFYEGEAVADRLERTLRSQVMDEKVPAMVAAEAAKITAGAATQIDKARKIYAFCVSEIKQGWNRDPCQTILKKEGSAAELFESLARAAGITVIAVRFSQTQTTGVDWDFAGSPSLQQGVFCLRLEDGSEIWLAPGRFVPFGCLPDNAYGAPAVLISRNSCTVTEIPSKPLPERTSTINASVAIQADGAADVSGALVVPGFEAASLRVMLEKYVTQAQMKMIVSMILNQIFRGITVDSFDLTAFDIGNPVAKLEFKGRLAMFGTKGQAGLSFKPVMRPLALSRAFARETTRRFPLRLFGGFSRGGAGMQLSTSKSADSFTFVLPEGASVKRPRSVIIFGEFGDYALTYSLEGNTLKVDRKFSIAQKDVPPDRYEAFQKFLKHVDQWEMESVDIAPAGK